MRIRITKGRFAVAVAMMPVLYLFNIGPLIYCNYRFDLDRRVIAILYGPFVQAIGGTWFAEPYHRYMDWWAAFAGYRDIND